MVAIIDAESRSLIMSSDSFVLGDCGKLSPSEGCINSRYFTLYLDPLVALEVDRQWAYESFRFSVVRVCVFMSPTGNANGVEVASEQFHGCFEFYVSASFDLLGWKLSHAKGKDLYLREGVKLGSCSRRAM
ncbi:hypothetical protein [Stenotrophomonas sp. BIGb0135]|uniref:hypothetical protein n=1 Tax=Stenotrophomonas sp. BIGb0135 TaxID=2940620 RepID=UPI002168790B|nr:hypothetical protein [Stenotrophomonas sp. BIGb0135]MCS4237047.1 hypothetical protein [Stenotrophomonas sp. BIGb0135]